MFCLGMIFKDACQAVAVPLCAIAAFAQTGTLPSEPPPAQGQIALPSGQSAPAVRNLTAVTPQYNFSYGPDPLQPLLPTSGIWNFFMPVQVTSQTPGWTVGEYDIQGLVDSFYHEPNYTTGGTVAGGCTWNASYDSPPYWYYENGPITNNQYEILSGAILRNAAAIGSVYQSASQQVSGTGVRLDGFGAMAAWDQHVYTSAPFVTGAIYWASDSCYSGDTEYGFAHYNYYNPPLDQFYFYKYSNCSAPSGQPGSYSCYLTKSAAEPQPQCSAAVNLPTLALNSKGNNWYLWYANVDQNPVPPNGNGHWVFSAGVLDPYTLNAAWSCIADPLASTTFPVSQCPQQGSVNFLCNTPFPTRQLHQAMGSVTAGMTNASNMPPTGRVNPMLRMSQLYIMLP
jgi:hypothetical protein